MTDLERIAEIVKGNMQTLDNFKKMYVERLHELEQENPNGCEAFYCRGALDMLEMALTFENSESYFLELLQK